MPVVYRPARMQELERANALVIASMNELTVRHGFGPMGAVRPPKFQQFALQDDPDGLWVAEDAGDIVGFGFSWVCGELWFLAQLFVSPDRQGHGIGDELLKRTLEHARKAGATNQALITFAFNTVSQGLYIRHGLLPRLLLYAVSVSRETLLGRLQRGGLRCVPLENTASHRQSLALIDDRALGVSRDKHHGYLIGDSATTGVLLYDGDDLAGYAYIASDGHIGPLAVAQPRLLGAAFRTALNLAADHGASQVSALLPGPSAAPGIALAHGMRIAFPMVLMSVRDVGGWSGYLPRNPGFM